ncbi:MAG TPA: hypothetical protein VFA21_22835 [Pyrinomonadaceae bacterium]|nr:hypothetical protein [Pyrinomonadaceae bacterium]
MTLDINEEERDYLLEILEARRAELLHELHHTDTLDFKEVLRRKMALVESLNNRLASAPAPGSR